MNARRGSGERPRVFVGLPLGPELCHAVGERVATTLPGSDWRLARPAGLHATLAFLGATERARLPGLFGELERALAGRRAPTLRLGATGAFPSLARPRVLWVGAEERSELGRLAACRNAVVDAVLAAGIDLGDERTRPFRPHVTVARPHGRRARVPEAFRELAFDLEWNPAAVVFFESVPGPGGSRYEPLATWPLGANT